MLSNHWTFLPFYYRDYTFLKLNLFSWVLLHCSVVVWTPTSSSAWLKDHMLDHIIGPRDRNCLGLFFMYFVWRFKLFSWKHLIFLTCKVVWTANLPHRHWEVLPVKCLEGIQNTLIKGDTEGQRFVNAFGKFWTRFPPLLDLLESLDYVWLTYREVLYWLFSLVTNTSKLMQLRSGLK